MLDFKDVTDEQMLLEMNKRGLLKALQGVSANLDTVNTDLIMKELEKRYMQFVFMGRQNLSDDPSNLTGTWALRKSASGDLFACCGLAFMLAEEMSKDLKRHGSGFGEMNSQQPQQEPGTANIEKDNRGNIRIT